MPRFRLAIIAPDHLDGTSWYRAAGPLAHLARFVMRDLEFVPVLEPAGWSSFMFCDAVFIQRPHSPQALDWLRMANEMRIPVWMDLDDDLQSLPPEHKSFLPFQKVKAEVAEILERATAISVSTKALAEKVAGQTKAAIFHIPNAVDETLMHYSPPRPLDPSFLAWRGSDSHREDIELARDLFTRPDIKMHYFGHVPPWLRNGDTITPWLRPSRFIQELPHTQAGCLVVPLKDHAFNRARSNCSWLEATWAGLATAHVTDSGEALPEFRVPGMLSLEELAAATPESLTKARAESLEHVRANLTLATVNKLRVELIESL